MTTAGQLTYYAGIIAFTLTAVAWDVKSRRIPNWLNVAALAAGIGWHILFGTMSTLADAGLAFGVGFGTLLILWLIGGGGAGDVKLMGALAVWLGFRATVWVIVLSAILIAILGVTMTVVNGVRSLLGARNSDASKGRRKVPFAVPAAISTWAVLLLHAVRVATAT